MLCKERVGACIQCSVKTCKTAYHVTCAFKKGLEMRAIIEDENAEDGVKLRVRKKEIVAPFQIQSRGVPTSSFSVVFYMFYMRQFKVLPLA